MSVVRLRSVLAAGQVVTNVMAGNKFEFLGRPSAVRIWATEDGAGSIAAGGAGAQVDFTLGNVVVGDDLPPNSAVTVGAVAKDADGLAAGVGDAGDRVQIRVQNTDAANPVNVTFLIEIAEIG